MATEQPGTRLDDVEHGVKVSEHLEFIDWIEANPEEAMLSFRASGVAEDTCNRTTATISDWGLGGEDMDDREHTLEFGLPTGLEEPMGYTDPTDRYEAIEGALAGLTACINGTIQYNAIREGIPIEDVETRVRIPTDLRVLFGIHDVDQADGLFGEPQIDVDVTGNDLTDEDVERIKEFPKRSPVYNLVTLEHPNTPNVTVETGY
jgi:uncharacterized OsmC-like protein